MVVVAVVEGGERVGGGREGREWAQEKRVLRASAVFEAHLGQREARVVVQLGDDAARVALVGCQLVRQQVPQRRQRLTRPYAPALGLLFSVFSTLLLFRISFSNIFSI